MSKCQVCDTTEKIVYSGVDALLLGIEGAETGKICYPCANQARREAQKKEATTDGTL